VPAPRPDPPATVQPGGAVLVTAAQHKRRGKKGAPPPGPPPPPQNAAPAHRPTPRRAAGAWTCAPNRVLELCTGNSRLLSGPATFDLECGCPALGAYRGNLQLHAIGVTPGPPLRHPAKGWQRKTRLFQLPSTAAGPGGWGARWRPARNRQQAEWQASCCAGAGPLHGLCDRARCRNLNPVSYGLPHNLPKPPQTRPAGGFPSTMRQTGVTGPELVFLSALRSMPPWIVCA